MGAWFLKGFCQGTLGDQQEGSRCKAGEDQAKGACSVVLRAPPGVSASL